MFELPWIHFILEYEYALLYIIQKIKRVKLSEVCSPAHNHPLLNTSENQSSTKCATTMSRHRARLPLHMATRIAPPGKAGTGMSKHLPDSPVRDADEPHTREVSPFLLGALLWLKAPSWGLGRESQGQNSFISAPSLGQGRRETWPVPEEGERSPALPSLPSTTLLLPWLLLLPWA